jgi:murein DD-endopeptidase MepM/ murein hydrolase activator NlpD
MKTTNGKCMILLDISHHQKKIDFSKIKNLCICKASEGTGFVDNMFEYNRSELRKRKLYLGAYHFANSGDAVKEAQHFLKVVGKVEEGELVVIDYENFKLNDPAKWCLEFSKEVEKSIGKKPMLYTYHELLLNYNWKKLSDNGNQLWAARYGLQEQIPNINYKPVTGSFKYYKIWQFCSKGTMPGITTLVDLNTTELSEQELRKLCSVGDNPVNENMSKCVFPMDKVYVTQHFGERPEVYSRFGLEGHNGIDFRTRFWDTPLGRRYINPIMNGVVTEVGNQGAVGYGKFIRIKHHGTEETVYGHLYRIYVKVGQFVTTGQDIALTDNTGFSSGPHLHLGWRPDGWEKNYKNGYKGFDDPEKILPELRADK